MIAVTIDWPISFNRYKDARQRTTRKGRLWRDSAVDQVWHGLGGRPDLLIGPVKLTFLACPPMYTRTVNGDRKWNYSWDLDNYSGKHIWDMLQKAHVLKDDSHVYEDYRRKGPTTHYGMLHITAEEI